MKVSARVLADSGLLIEILSRSVIGEAGGENVFLHSSWSGNGARPEISFGLEVEVEYGKEPEFRWRIKTVRGDETEVGVKPERGARFSDDLETRDVESIVLLDPRRWRSVTEWRAERSLYSDGDRDSSRDVTTLGSDLSPTETV